jgi:glycerate dehydrogenase
VITPHVAWASREARLRLMDIAADNVAAFLDGRPQNVVN